MEKVIDKTKKNHLEETQKNIINMKSEVQQKLKLIDTDFRLTVFAKVIDTYSAIFKFVSIYECYTDHDKADDKDLSNLDKFIKIAFVLETFMAIDHFFKEIFKILNTEQKKHNTPPISEIIKDLEKKGLIDKTSENYAKFKRFKDVRNASHNNFIDIEKGELIDEAKKDVYKRVNPLIEGSLNFIKQIIYNFADKYPEYSNRKIEDPIAKLKN